MSWLPSLITSTPEEGYELAIALSRMAVKKTQPDDASRQSQQTENASWICARFRQPDPGLACRRHKLQHGGAGQQLLEGLRRVEKMRLALVSLGSRAGPHLRPWY